MIQHVRKYAVGVLCVVVAFATLVGMVALVDSTYAAPSGSVDIGVSVGGSDVTINSPKDGTITDNPNINVNISYGAGVRTIQVIVDGQVVGTLSVDGQYGPGQVNFPFKLTEGAQTITIRGYDGDENFVGEDSITITYYDKLLPDIPGTGIMQIGSFMIATSDVIWFSIFILLIGGVIVVTIAENKYDARKRKSTKKVKAGR